VGVGTGLSYFSAFVFCCFAFAGRDEDGPTRRLCTDATAGFGVMVPLLWGVSDRVSIVPNRKSVRYPTRAGSRRHLKLVHRRRN